MAHSYQPTQAPEAVAAPDTAPDGTKLYHCGPLTYTKAGLAVLFAWLLWGDFCFTLMESVVPNILPLKLKALGASNTTMALILSVLPGVLNMTVCPWVSSASDRHRGRWGRRIPYILWTLPFLTISLTLLGWSEDLTKLLIQVVPPLARVAPATITVVLIAVFVVSFAFFNMFVGSVFWYLFNDVVPPQFLGRFMGLFRIIGSVATILFFKYIFKHGETHTREIFTGAALLYFVGFGLMCLRVKEGPYPPPPDDVANQGLAAGIRAFVKQSFSARFYWYFYLMQTFWVAGGAMNMFIVFFNQEMGLTLDQIGDINAYGTGAMLAATWFTAIFVDRWHPLRIKAYLCVFAATTGFGAWVWLTMTLPAEVFFWLSLGGLLVTRFSFTLGEQCAIPIFMRLMPKSLYGQFSSANAMVRTLGGTLMGGMLAGVCMDGLKWAYDGSDFAYRWVWLWGWLFMIVSSFFVCMGYREWKRLGGDDNYRPPAPWKPEGYEEVADKVKSVPPHPRWVMISMWLGVWAIVINVLLVPIFLYFMHTHGMDQAMYWYLWYFVPIKIGLLIAAYWQLVHVRRDIEAQERGEPTRYGLPHHGVMLVNAIQGLVYFPLYWYQTIKMIELGLNHEQIIFGVANLLSTAGTILGVHVIRWIERPLAAPAASYAQETAEGTYPSLTDGEDALVGKPAGGASPTQTSQA